MKRTQPCTQGHHMTQSPGDQRWDIQLPIRRARWGRTLRSDSICWAMIPRRSR